MFHALKLLALLMASVSSNTPEPAAGLRLPPGFQVTEYADSKLANDIYTMTIDPQGRVIVAGRGYIRILFDDNQDGTADRAQEFASAPKDGAMGLLWEGDALYVTGDGGLRRFRDADGDGKADGPPDLIRKLKTGGEHDAHAIHRGPDGWLYVLCGNSTGIDAGFAQTDSSPIQKPIAGCVIRFSPDLRTSEIVADGFRNPYGMDFNPDGELFTFDSDNERCVSLPWYEPMRFYHVVPGGHYGWLNPQHAQFWRLPPQAVDVVPPLCTLGRGSPTGIVCYRHAQFPARYRGGFFLLDWTFGKVHFVALAAQGSSYAAKPEVFLEATGDNGFAPTACAVHPLTGDLFISIGGRGTRGAVYRVRYTGDAEKGKTPAVPDRSLAWQPEMHARLLREAAAEDRAVRPRAISDILRHKGHFNKAEIRQAIQANCGEGDRLLRQATAHLIARTLTPDDRLLLVRDSRTRAELLTTMLAVCDAGQTVAASDAPLCKRLGDIVSDPQAPVPERMAAVRIMQLLLGDIVAPQSKGTIWEGYSCRGKPLLEMPEAALTSLVAGCFPTRHPELDREISRTLAMVQSSDPTLPGKVAAMWNDQTDPVDDIHYLAVLARLRGPRTPDLTGRTATALLTLDRKIVQRELNRDRHWPLRMKEIQESLMQQDSQLGLAMLKHPDFGRVDHALFALAPGFDRRQAAEGFLKRAAANRDFEWSPMLVEVISSLPTERSLPILRQQWDQHGLREAILPVLAREPDETDRDRFLDGLASPQIATVRVCLDALGRLPAPGDGRQLLPVVRCLRSLGEGREEKPLRERALGLLARWTQAKPEPSTAEGWSRWFAERHPDLAERLNGADGVDVAAWQKRLALVEWAAGTGERGRAVFTRTGCSACHSGAQALGPDLRGVTGRFSRDDLLTAILQPSRDVSPRYQTTLIATTDGKVYQGCIIYEAVDGVILQTGPTTTQRISGSQIASRKVTPRSLMPAGLLDPCTPQEIADLVAYLKSLQGP